MELASQAATTVSVVSAIENERYTPGLDVARRLAVAMGVTVDSLCGPRRKRVAAHTA